MSFSDSTPPKWSLALDKTAPWSLTSDTEEDEGGGSGQEDEGHLVQLEIVHPSTEEGQTNMPVRTKVEFLISRAGVLRLPEAAQRSPAQELHWQMLPHTTIPVSTRTIYKWTDFGKNLFIFQAKYFHFISSPEKCG